MNIVGRQFMTLTAYWRLLAAGEEEAEETPARIRSLGLSMQFADQVSPPHLLSGEYGSGKTAQARL